VALLFPASNIIFKNIFVFTKQTFDSEKIYGTHYPHGGPLKNLKIFTKYKCFVIFEKKYK